MDSIWGFIGYSSVGFFLGVLVVNLFAWSFRKKLLAAESAAIRRLVRLIEDIDNVDFERTPQRRAA